MARFESHKQALEWMQQHPGKAIFVESCNGSYMIDEEEPNLILFKDFGYDYDCFGNYIPFDKFLEYSEDEVLNTENI